MSEHEQFLRDLSGDLIKDGRLSVGERIKAIADYIAQLEANQHRHPNKEKREARRERIEEEMATGWGDE